jgi:hypothetical protein
LYLESGFSISGGHKVKWKSPWQALAPIAACFSGTDPMPAINPTNLGDNPYIAVLSKIQAVPHGIPDVHRINC